MTNEFSELQKRITEIGVNFQSLLDRDPLNQTDQKSQDIIKAYILLCHAEFEIYFEELTKNTLKKIYLETKRSRYVRKYINAFDNQLDLFSEIVKKNNGIKKDNICKLLKLCGFEINRISDSYISSLNSFGNKRGNFAHNGNSSINTLLSFSQEKNLIESLVNETLTEIDKYF